MWRDKELKREKVSPEVYAKLCLYTAGLLSLYHEQSLLKKVCLPHIDQRNYERKHLILFWVKMYI